MKCQIYVRQFKFRKTYPKLNSYFSKNIRIIYMNRTPHLLDEYLKNDGNYSKF